MKKGLKQAKIDQLQLSFLAKICVLEKKSLNKKSLELYFQQLLFYEVCSKTPPFARNGQFLRDHSEILIKTSGKLPP